MKRFLKITSLALGTLLVLLFLGLVAVSAYLSTPRFLNAALLRINQAIPGRVTLAKHRLALWKGTLELWDGTVTTPAGDTPLGFDRLALAIDWLALLRGEVEFRRILLTKPRVAMVQGQDGKFTLLAALVAQGETNTTDRSAEPALPLNIRIRALQIESGHLIYSDAVTPFRAGVDAIDATMSMDLAADDFKLKLKTGPVRLDMREFNTELSHIRLEAALKEKRLMVSDLEVRVKSSTIRISGQADDLLAQPHLDLRVSADARLEDFEALVGGVTAMAGPARIQMQVQGSIGNPHVALAMQSGAVRLAAWRIDDARLVLDLTDRVLTVNALDVYTAEGRLAATGVFDAQAVFPDGLLPWAPRLERLAYEISVEGEKLDLSKIQATQNFLNGRVGGRISITGQGVTDSGRSATVTVAAQATGMTAAARAKPMDARLSGQFAVAGSDLLVKRVTVAAEQAETTLAAAGALALAKRNLDLKVDVTVGNLAGLLAVAGIKGARGSVALAAEVSGAIRRPRVKLTLSGDQLGYDSFHAGALQCEARLDEDGQFKVTQFDFRHRDGRVQGHGAIRLLTEDGQWAHPMPVEVAATFGGLRPEDFWNEAPVTGTFDGDVHLSGSVQQPAGALSLHARTLTTIVGPVDTVDLRASLAQGVLEIEKIDLVRRQGNLHITGRTGLLAPDTFKVQHNPHFELELVGRRIDIADFSEAAEGTAAFNAHLAGTVTDPAGTFSMQVDRAAVKGQRFEKIELEAVIGDRKINLAPLRLSGGGTDEMTADGWIAFDRRFALNARSRGFALRKIDVIGQNGSIGGSLRFNAAAHGSLSAPVIDGDIHVGDLTLNQQPFEDIRLEVTVRGKDARLKASQAFDLDASFGLENRDFDLAAVFDQTQLKPYLALTGLKDLSGMVTGTVEAHGNAGRLKEATAKVDLALLKVFYGTETLAATRSFKAELKDNRFVLPESTWALFEQGGLTLHGQGAFDGSINLQVDGTVPLKGFEPFLQAIEDPRGQIVVQAAIAGKAANPSINARVTLENLEGTLPFVLQRLSGLNGTVQVSDSQVTLADISGQINKGRFNISGTLGLDQWQPEKVDLVFNADQLPIEVPDTMSLTLNSRLSLKGDLSKAHAQGEIVLNEGLYYKNVDLNPLRGFTAVRRQGPARVETAIPYLGHTTLDVAVKRRQPFVVDNNLAYLEIGPDLRLQGTVDNPVLNGRAQVDSGEVYYAGKTFVVKRGIVDFLNPYKIEPTLDIRSEVTVRHWLITLLISGKPDDLKVELSSDPPEQKGDILSLLVAGRTSAEIRGGSGSAGMSANQMMAQLVASTLGDDIKKVTGVDVLEVETISDQTDDGSDLIKVTVGKKLSERMTVKYAVSSKQGETIQRAISEYQLMDSLLVSGFQETNGIYGGELVFRIEFR
jgi:autotransporter translocation and assembly factor TamB